MSTPELLDSRQHARLRIRDTAVQTPHFVQVFAGEFAAAATCCPVLFTKDTTDGSFFPGAVFGFKAGENLLGSVEERGGFDPLVLRREGFFISGQQIAIDREHARFGETDGEPLFDDAGAPAPALRKMQHVLGDIHAGTEQTRAFVAAVSDLALIEPVEVSLSFRDGERITLQGLYTVSLDRLRDIDDASALRLFRAGHLQSAYLMWASLRHIGRLAQLRDARA